METPGQTNLEPGGRVEITSQAAIFNASVKAFALMAAP